jgi:actin-related protein
MGGLYKMDKKIEFEDADSSALVFGPMAVFSQQSTGPPKGLEISSVTSNCYVSKVYRVRKQGQRNI